MGPKGFEAEEQHQIRLGMLTVQSLKETIETAAPLFICSCALLFFSVSIGLK